MYVWRARPGWVAMHWNGDLVEARHHHVSRVLSAQHTYAIDFFLETVMQFHCKIHFR